MNFQDLKKIETPDIYLDIAFHNAKKYIENKRVNQRKSKLEKKRTLEMSRITKVTKSLNNMLMKILVSFPNLDDLDEFYLELIKIKLDYVSMKKSLGAIAWANRKISEFHRVYLKKIRLPRRLI